VDLQRCDGASTGATVQERALPSMVRPYGRSIIVRPGSVLLAMTAAVTVGLVGAGVPGTAAPSAAQVESVHLGAVLVGGNEVSTPGDPDGFGFADVRVRRGEVCWRISVQSVAPITAAHIHAGPKGVTGPVVVPLEPYRAGCVDTRRRTARFIRQHPGEFYVNVHNAEFPAGALRGQLRR
jgi:hypothetical protein